MDLDSEIIPGIGISGVVAEILGLWNNLEDRIGGVLDKNAAGESKRIGVDHGPRE